MCRTLGVQIVHANANEFPIAACLVYHVWEVNLEGHVNLMMPKDKTAKNLQRYTYQDLIKAINVTADASLLDVYTDFGVWIKAYQNAGIPPEMKEDELAISTSELKS